MIRELHPANYVPGEGYHILVGDSSDNYIDGSGDFNFIYLSVTIE